MHWVTDGLDCDDGILIPRQQSDWAQHNGVTCDAAELQLLRDMWTMWTIRSLTHLAWAVTMLSG